MKTRMVAIFTVFALLYGAVGVRLYGLATEEVKAAGNTKRKYTIEIMPVRGDVLDCKGNKLVSQDYENIVAAKPTYTALTALEKVLDEDSFALLRERVQRQSAVSLSIGKFEIDDTQDTVTVRKYLRYSDAQTADHIIGYLNGEGHGVYGIEKSFDSVLFTGKSVSASFAADVNGRVLSGSEITLNNNGIQTGTVMLTLDSGIQKITEDALDKNGVERGAAAVIDVNSGAVRAIVSRPDFDARNISASLDDENSPLVNRALGAYSVGSVFKVVVASAALESGFESFSYECKGTCDVDGTVFSCNRKTPHGKLDMTKALECSCNTYFIELARKVGTKKILETASLMGFGQEIELADGIVSKSGVLPSAEELESTGAFANFSFGQGRFTATALQLGNMMSAVAGKGKYHKPYLVEKVTDDKGNTVVSHKGGYPVYALSEKTSLKLTGMLTSVIENGNGQAAKLENGVAAAGKTATAQTGIFDKNGKEICNTWFAGFFKSPKTTYAVVILKEDGVSGAVDCAPVFKCIADEIVRFEKNS